MSRQPPLAAIFAVLSLASVAISQTRVAPVQYAAKPRLAVGDLLIASEKLTDPNFAESVVLILEYSEDDGTLGLIVNRQSDVQLAKLFPHLKGANSDPVFQGGPVSPGFALALLRSSVKPDQGKPVVGDVYVSGSKDIIEKSVTSRVQPSKFRLYLGYAGWAAGQLEAELALGAWSPLKGAPRIIFDPDPDSLWSRLSRESQMQIAALRFLRSPIQ